jgi:hypothetical protein
MRWRQRKTQLYKEVCEVRTELDELKQKIEHHKEAWLRDLATLSTLLSSHR